MVSYITFNKSKHDPSLLSIYNARRGGGSGGGVGKVVTPPFLPQNKIRFLEKKDHMSKIHAQDKHVIEIRRE